MGVFSRGTEEPCDMLDRYGGLGFRVFRAFRAFKAFRAFTGLRV